MNNEKVVEEIVIPPQSSIELESHGAGNERYPRYYTWRVKIYCNDLDLAFAEIKRIDKQLKEKYL